MAKAALKSILAAGASLAILASCGGNDSDVSLGSDGPVSSEQPIVHAVGNAAGRSPPHPSRSIKASPKGL